MLGTNTGWAAIPVVKDGKAVAAINVPQNATLQELFAAEELQRYVKKASGALLAIEKGRAPRGKPAIVVCLAEKLNYMAEQALPEEMKLSSEGICSFPSGRHFLITGGGPRGIVYAVYNFLEYIGYRWYWPGETGEVTPTLRDIAVEGFNVWHEPSFRRRHAMGGSDDGSGDLRWSLDRKDWLTKNHQNFWVREVRHKDYRNFMKKRGGSYTKAGSGHNWQHIISPKRYFKTHPEWFALIKGKRQSGGAQLCLSNPEVIRKLTKYALWAAELQRTKYPNIMHIDMTQNDGHGWCECSRCRAIDDKDPNTKADIVLWAVNQIAEKVTKKYPKAILLTCAYAGSAAPPSWIKPHKNVMIEQANYCFNYGASFLNPGAKRTSIYKEYLDRWAELTELHSIYEYFGFYGWLEALPVTLYRLSEEIAYYKKIGVDDFYSETEERWSTNHLLYYAFSRLWWDHTTDVEAMLDEFFRLFYGPAEQPMRDFHLALETSGGRNRCWVGIESELLRIFPLKLRQKCRADLEKAKGLAMDNPTIMARLAFVELGWRYTELHLEAMEAHRTFWKKPTAENKEMARKAWQRYVEFFDELKGTGAFAEKDLPKFKAKAEEQLKAYSLDLTALPAGVVKYSDKYDKYSGGGNARIHGQVKGFFGGPWGLSLYPRGTGSVTYELGAQPGHKWSKVSVRFQGRWREGMENAVEFSLDGRNWQIVTRNSRPSDAEKSDIFRQALGRERFWVRCWYKNTLPEDAIALFSVQIEGVIE